MTTTETTGELTAAQPLTELWYTRCPVPTASGIAQNRRWLQSAFADVGINLASVRDSPDRSIRDSHFRHHLGGSFREGGNVPPIWARSLGRDITVVAITWVDEAQLVLVRPDDEISTVADLRGKRLGLGRKDSGDIVDVLRAESLRGLLTALDAHGVGRDEVTWVDVPAAAWDIKDPDEERPNPLTRALRDGRVDAVFVKGAGVHAALEEGLRPIFDNNTLEDPLLRVSAGSPRPVTVDSATLDRHPEVVDRYLAVLLATARWARDHADEVARTVAAETRTTSAAVARAFGPALHESFEPSLDPTRLAGLVSQKDFLLAEGFIPDDFDVDAWIDPAPLERARALAAEIRLH